MHRKTFKITQTKKVRKSHQRKFYSENKNLFNAMSNGLGTKKAKGKQKNGFDDY